jgi:hypothetical protein
MSGFGRPVVEASFSDTKEATFFADIFGSDVSPLAEVEQPTSNMPTAVVARSEVPAGNLIMNVASSYRAIKVNGGEKRSRFHCITHWFQLNFLGQSNAYYLGRGLHPFR